MENVVRLPCKPGVEYDLRAMALIGRLSEAATQAYELTMICSDNHLGARASQVAEKLLGPLTAIEETVSLLELHADMILDAMSENVPAYFFNPDCSGPMTVTSLVLKRCYTLRVQDFYIEQTPVKMIQDNLDLTFRSYGGLLACELL